MTRSKKLSPELRDLTLRQLEARLHKLQLLRQTPRPRKGWIRTIREGLGMELRQLASRAELSANTVSEMEARETSDAITLASLRKMADALDADLVYAIVPRRPLTDVRDDQARQYAAELVSGVSHTMALEAQAVSETERDRQSVDLAQRMVREWSPEIWNTKA